MQSVVPVPRPAGRRSAAVTHLLLLLAAAGLLLGATAWLVPADGTRSDGPRAAPYRWITIARGVALAPSHQRVEVASVPASF